MFQKDKEYQNHGLEHKQSGENFWCNCTLKYCLNFSGKTLSRDGFQTRFNSISPLNNIKNGLDQAAIPYN